MNKINIFSLGGLQTIVKIRADANLSFDVFFPRKRVRSLTNVPTYYVGCIVRNPPVMSVFIAQLRSIEAVSYFCYCYFCLNELFLVFQEI